MTIASTTARNAYTGTGTVGPFAYTFRLTTVSDLDVIVTDGVTGLDTTLAYPGDYTVSGVLAGTGGDVTLANVLAVGDTITLRRSLALTQPTDLRTLGSFTPSVHEDALDRIVMQNIQQQDVLDRSIRLPASIDPDDFDTTLPANMTAGDAVVVNIAGTGLSMGALTAAQLSAWDAAHNQRLDAFTVTTHFTAGVTTQLTLTNPPGSVSNVEIVRRTSGSVVRYMSDEFSVAGSVITFTSAIPANTTRVEVQYHYTYQVNTVDAANATWNASGVGAVGRTVRDKVRERVSATDYYSSAFTNWAPAINAALLAVYNAGGGIVVAPDGTSDISVGLNAYDGVGFHGGENSTIRVKAGLGAGIIMWTQVANGNKGAIRNITFDQRADLYPSNGNLQCISVNATSGYTLENVNVYNAATMAVWADSGTAHPTTNLVIRGGNIIGYAGGVGMTDGTAGGISLFGRMYNIRIEGVHLENHRDDAIAFQDTDADPLGTHTGAFGERITITGCTGKNNNRRLTIDGGLSYSAPHFCIIYGCLDVTVTGCVSNGTVAEAFLALEGAFNPCENVVFTGCTSRNAGVSPDSVVGVPIAGFAARLVNGVTFTGCNATLTNGPGYQLITCTGVQFNGGQSYLNGNAGVSIRDCVGVEGGVFCYDNGTSGVEPYGLLIESQSANAVDNINWNRGGLFETRAGGARTQTHGVFYVGGANIGLVRISNTLIDNNATAAYGGAPSTSCWLVDNPAYNPVGCIAQGLGATPWTFDCGMSPEVINIAGGTVTLVERSDGLGGWVTVGVASPCTLHLNPGQSMRLTYTSAPLMSRDIQ
jgi:hypothetical protein